MFASNTSQVANDAVFVEDTFSCTLYTGNGSTQTITNGIDLSTYGGMTWFAGRNYSGYNHAIVDTARGMGYNIYSNTTGAQVQWDAVTPTTSGFSLSGGSAANVNNSGLDFASWTFRKQPKFFDVVTYTGNGTNGRTVAHSLGSVPGCMIVKRTDAANGWAVYHRAMNASPQDYMMRLNATDGAFTTSPSRWNNTLPTSTEFTLSGNDEVNGSGATYVAYLFAHNAGGFGLTGTDNVISCGSYTGNGSATGPVIDLGYEPQWVMIKRTDSTGDWVMFDIMRGMTVGDGDAYLYANSSAAESTSATRVGPNATGFYLKTVAASLNASGGTYIYIAIRRGPMKVPTSGTSVFKPSTVGATNNVTVGFPSDSAWFRNTGSGNDWRIFDRLRSGYELATNLTSAEGTYNYSPTYIHWDTNSVWNQNLENAPLANYFFGRAPSFFDEVCYTGTGSATTQTHNLGVVPELMMVKARSSGTYNWQVYHSALGNSQAVCTNLDIAAYSTVTQWNATTPTSTVFSIGTGATNVSSVTYVAYLFATCAGVSKCTAFTGTGTLQTIDCGFTGGARFVLIKRTDSTGDWYVWDSSRGLSSSTDPYLLLNSTAAEVTSTNWVDTTSTGFQVTAASGNNVNINGASYIALAIS